MLRVDMNLPPPQKKEKRKGNENETKEAKERHEEVMLRT
jgi:hypothetical protein